MGLSTTEEIDFINGKVLTGTESSIGLLNNEAYLISQCGYNSDTFLSFGGQTVDGDYLDSFEMLGGMYTRCI